MAHLPFLAPALEDIDSINFALGLRDFDVARHQPHPPGYPVYIALGRLALPVVGAVAPGDNRTAVEARSLAIWSALSGAIALAAAWSIFASLERLRSSTDVANRTRTMHVAETWATALLAVVPLFWISGLRPMSDMPGLAGALVAQALLIRGFRERKALVTGALIAGLTVGIRTQTIWLTAPLLAYAMVAQRRAGLLWLATRPLAVLLAGGFVWLGPMLVASGGVTGYLSALQSQAGEDFAWVDMLWANPTPRRLASALYETFVLPFGSVALAIVAGVCVVVGASVAVARERRTLLLIGLAFAPYLSFHLLFQETGHVRYALPVLPALAWFATRGATVMRRFAWPAMGALVLFALVEDLPTAAAYGREAAPAFRSIAAMNAASEAAPPAAVHSHYALARPLRAAASISLPIVDPRRDYEWLGLVEHWRNGGRGAIWFLADPRRTDLALIDPQSRSDVTAFRWRVGDRLELSGVRPNGVDWYRFPSPPGWIAGEGWALTPETGGIARASGTGLESRTIEAYVRRRTGPVHLLIGGRHLGSAADPAAVFELSVDDQSIETWTLDPKAGNLNFLRFVALAQGLPEGPEDYARLTISARAADANRPTPPVAIRQFDIQSADTMMYGFGEGWHEAEYDNATGQRWRWTSRRSVLRVTPAGAVEVAMRGESPLKYFDAPPIVRVTAGGRSIGELRPSRDFEWRVMLSADEVKAASGAIAIETDRVYLPGEVEGTADQRQLGLRLFEIRVHPVRN